MVFIRDTHNSEYSTSPDGLLYSNFLLFSKMGELLCGLPNTNVVIPNISIELYGLQSQLHEVMNAMYAYSSCPHSLLQLFTVDARTFSSNFSSMQLWDFPIQQQYGRAPSSSFEISWPSFNKNSLSRTLKMQVITKF